MNFRRKIERKKVNKMANDIEFSAGLDTSDAIKSVKRFQNETSSSIKGITSGFAALGAVAGVAVAAIATGKLFSALQAVTAAAATQEIAVNKMNTALRLAGDFSAEASEDMQKFASDLQAVSTIGDETSLEMIGLAKSFGATNEQAKQLVTAAADLSASTGIELESAVRNLGKTFGGLTGELGELVPATRNLTKEQLQSGEAIALVTSRFGGAAQAAVNTYGGAIAQLSNTFGDFQESLGALITSNPIVISSIKQLTQVFQLLIQGVSNNQEALGRLVSAGFKLLLDSIPATIRGIEFTLIAFNSLGSSALNITTAVLRMTKAFLDFDVVRSVVNAIAEATRTLAFQTATALKAIAEMVQKIPGAEAVFGDLGVSIDGVIENLGDFGESQKAAFGTDTAQDFIDKINDAEQAIQLFSDNSDQNFDGLIEKLASFRGDINALIEAAANGSLDLGDLNANINASGSVDNKELIDALKNAKKDDKKKEKPTFDQMVDTFIRKGGEQGDAIAKFILDGLEGFNELFGPTIATFAKFARDIWTEGARILGEAARFVGEEATAFVTGALGAVPANALQGRAGAVNVLGAGAGAAADAFVPGLGSIVSPIVKTLAEQGAEGTKALVKEFADAFPELVNNLVEAAPVFIEELAKNADKIILAIIGALPRVIVALIKAQPKIALELAKATGRAVESIFLTLIGDLSNGLEEITGFVDQNKLTAEAAGNQIRAGRDAYIEGLQTARNFFAKDLPELYKSIFNNLISTIVNGAKLFGVSIATSFKGAFAASIQPLVSGLTAATTSMQKSLSSVSKAVSSLSSNGTKLSSAVSKIVALKTPFQNLVNAINGLINRVSDALTGGGVSDIGGSGQGLIPDSVPILGGLATGGIVGGSGNKDNQLFALTPGELVVDRSTGPRLNKFLDSFDNRSDNTNQGGGITDQLLVRVIDLLSQPIETNAQININGRSLAEAILELNRSNARIA